MLHSHETAGRIQSTNLKFISMAPEEGKSFLAERSIQGKSAEEIRIAIMASPMMWTIKLNDEELTQVSAYL